MFAVFVCGVVFGLFTLGTIAGLKQGNAALSVVGLFILMGSSGAAIWLANA